MADTLVTALETASGATTNTTTRAVHRPGRSRRNLSNSAKKKSKTPGQRLLTAALVVIWVGVSGAALWGGLEYYATPFQERPFSDLHELYKPSGLIGQGIGIFGTLLMLIGVGMYSLRKRVSLLAGVGKLSTWLEIHIFLCTLGPLLVLFHTSFRFGGIISIAFWSMSIVVLSGVFGRYLYSRIPRTIHGQFRSLESIRQQKQELVTTISNDFGLKPAQVELLFPQTMRREPRGLLHALSLAIRYDLAKRTQKRRVERILTSVSSHSDSMPLYARDSVVAIVQLQLRLEQQIVLLEPFQRLFRYWHLLHLPLAGVMLLILTVHVAVAILFGYTWVF